MPRYDEMRYLSTHNSYSGSIAGDRKSIAEQLQAGVRCIELDLHDNGYSDPQVDGYRLGHMGPGDEVDTSGGNPANSLLLEHWLGAAKAWSAAHAGHAPITIVLDLKDDLTDNPKGGDPLDLNGVVEGVLSAHLYRRSDYAGQWPQRWEELKDRFICVLSGDQHTRSCYRWDFGASPAIAINTAGDAVMALREASGDLFCWSGKAAAGAIDWSRRNPYAHSNLGLSEPAIAINDDGWIVAVHRFDRPNMSDRLESWLGHLQLESGSPTGRISWFGKDVFADGIAPSLAIAGDKVTEIHRLRSGGRRRVTGTIDTTKRKIKWKKPETTTAQQFPVDSSQWNGSTISCGVDAAGWLGCRFDAGALQPVRFRQVLFVEMQDENQRPSLIDPVFFASSAGSKADIEAARNAGMVARGWNFKESNATSPANPRENFAATDRPFDPWYAAYMQGADVVTT